MTLSSGCATGGRNFGEDVKFLRQHTDVVVLQDAKGEAKVAVVPAWQGRVVTSTADGDRGDSFGWLNYKLVESGQTQAHINPYGGEDRFWLGPEGGQFSVFFKGNDPFNFEHWQTPPVIDTAAYEVKDQSNTSVSFRHKAVIENYSGTKFTVRIDRTVNLLSEADAKEALGVDIGDAELVAFETVNKITNAGRNEWKKDSGLLSVWILGMFKHSPKTTVVVPFKAGSEAELGPVVNDAYFGKVPAERLTIADGVMFFRGDGQYRSKIGVSPRRVTPIVGSFDGERNVLTIVQFNQPGPDVTDYVNSMWEHQDRPFGGDVVNSYNDGPLEPGGDQLGPFYELETSSPAAALEPQESLTHIHRTFHYQGARADLDRIAQAALGVSLAQIETAFE